MPWFLRMRLAVVVTGCLAAACGKTAPKVAPEAPPLVVPAPPARVLAPVDEPLVAAPGAPEAITEPPRAPVRTPPRRPAPAPTPAAEAEPKAAEAPPTPPVLEPARPAPTAADVAEDRRVREVLARAARDLGRVDYRLLSTQGRGQYEQSKRLTDQADQALKDRNFVFAATLADKAAAIATELAAR